MNQLAIDGGEPAIPEGPPDWPIADPEIAVALDEVFRSGDWGRYLGPCVDRLCERIAQLHEGAAVYPCCSGTVAVELALRGLKIGAGDEVILAAYDFPGNFRAIEAVDAKAVLVDVDPANWNLDPEQLEAAASPATRAVIVSHLHGGLVPMRRVREIADARGWGVVEDACQAVGATVEGRPAGAWGDVGVLSFGGSKLLTAGRGGAVFTPRQDVLQRIKIYSERGNRAFPLSELQAAVLLPQLDRLEERHARRHDAVARLSTRIDRIEGLAMFRNACQGDAAYYKLGVQYRAEVFRGAFVEGASSDRAFGNRTPNEGASSNRLITRDAFSAAVRAEGVALDPGFAGFARRSSKRCRSVGELPNARAAAEGTLVLHHPVLLTNDVTIDRVAAAIEKVARKFQKGP